MEQNAAGGEPRRIAKIMEGPMNFNLTYLDRKDITDEDEGLEEPSGLALRPGDDGFWTVSDDTKKIFKLDSEGNVDKDESFEIPVKGLEGITLDSTGEFLLTVKEESNEIIKIEIAEREVVAARPLSGMAGYDTIAPFFDGEGETKGLEGITWNGHSDTVFVVKEGLPGLLVEVSSDLQTIKGHRQLNEDNGFRDTNLSSDEIDFSGLCYDATRSAFWIVSDKAKRVYLYDWTANRVIQSAPLGYGDDGDYKEVEKGEGIAVDPEAKRLYVVSDEEGRIYVFDVRG